MLTFIKKYPNEKVLIPLVKDLMIDMLKLNKTRKISFTPPWVKIFLQK